MRPVKVCSEGTPFLKRSQRSSACLDNMRSQASELRLTGRGSARTSSSSGAAVGRGLSRPPRRASVALKLFLPLDERRQLSVLNKDLATTHMATLVTQSLDFQRREYQFVSRISHPTIVRALDVFSLDLSKAERDTLKSELDIDGVIQVPALLSEFVDGLALDKAIVQFNLSADEVAYALTRVAEALDYLHTHHNYLHTDVKLSNVLVRADIRERVLIDFALSKNFDFSQVAPGDARRLFGDLFPHLPEDHPLTRAKADGATREDFRRLAFPDLDLYQFGLMLKGLESATAQVFEERELRYLAVLQFELSDWERVSTWEPGQLADRVRRLSPSLSTPFRVTELAAPGVTERTIVLPDGQGAPITDVIAPVIATRSFGRLATVNQLSLLDVVYPAPATNAASMSSPRMSSCVNSPAICTRRHAFATSSIAAPCSSCCSWRCYTTSTISSSCTRFRRARSRRSPSYSFLISCATAS